MNKVTSRTKQGAVTGQGAKPLVTPLSLFSLAETDYGFSQQKYIDKNKIMSIDPKEFEKLLESGANPNERVSQMDNTFLHYLTEISNEELAKKLAQILIDYGADVNAKNHFGETPLMKAHTNGFLRKLIKNGADVNAVDRYGKSVLHHQVTWIYDKETKYIDEAIEVLAKNGADLNAESVGGGTPLSNARSFSTIKILVEQGADPNKLNKFGDSAIHSHVASKSDRDLLKILEYFVSVDAVDALTASDKDGITPLTLAIEKRFSAMPRKSIQYLIEHGADPFVVDNKGNTALHKALSRSSKFKIGKVKFLLENKLDPNIANNEGVTPLMLADSLQTAEFLVLAGANIYVQTNKQENVLHMMCKKKPNPDVVKYLIDKGLDINQLDKNGKTPLMALLMSKTLYEDSPEIKTIEVLLSYEAEINLKTKRGKELFPLLQQVKNKLQGSAKERMQNLIANIDFEKKVSMSNTDNFSFSL